MSNAVNGMDAFMAFIPIVWLLVSLGKLKLPTHWASGSALLITSAIALLYFKMPMNYLIQALLEGLAFALMPIIWVIISALFVYNITVKTGSLDIIKQMLCNISEDRRIQALILAFAFGGFLEAVAGFGTAVAIPAGILIAMGFSPFMAATVCLIANTIPVAFGVLGVPITTLAQVTSLDLAKLSLYTSLQLFPFAVLLPLVLVYVVTGKVRHLKGVVGISISAGLAFATGQTLAAIFIGPEIAAVVGSLASLFLIILWCKFFRRAPNWTFDGDNSSYTENVKISVGAAIKAWAPYLLVLLLVIGTRFLPFLSFLNNYPFVLKKQFYFGIGGKALTFQWATSGGTILLLSAIIGGLIQGLGMRIILKIFVSTVVQVKKTILTIISIVALAKIMTFSGMVDSIAILLAWVGGKRFPLISPFIGGLGTFITGSDTSSNVLFGNLQKQTAAQLNMNQEWLVAANASGATAGKMISPQSISIAATATNNPGQEGQMLAFTLKYCVIYVGLMGILVFLTQFLF